MSAKKLALGRGLDALFADAALTNVVDNFCSSPQNGVVRAIRLSYIEPRSDQPRKTFDKESLSQLADSILSHGVLQPVIVREIGGGSFQLIAGERRWRAAKIAGLDEIPAIIKDSGDLEAAEMTLIENLQREDLNPVEEAFGYKYLADSYGLKQEEIAAKVSKSRPAVANSLRLLALSPEILSFVAGGDLSSGHARALLSLENPERQFELAEQIIKNSLSVREAERLVKLARETPEDRAKPSLSMEDRHYINLQEKISAAIGVTAKIERSGSGGFLKLSYKNSDQLEELTKLLCKEDIINA